MIAQDKQLHLLTGGLLVIGLHFLGVSLLSCFIISMIAGATKEVYDWFHPDIHTCDWWDFVATSAGGGIACLLIRLVT
jgi:hypothetical protein